MTRLDVRFSVKEQLITLLDKEPLRAGDKNYFYAVFDLCETWDNVANIYASFERDELSFMVPLTPSADGCLECRMPWEVMTEKGEFYVGVFGGQRILTNKVRVDVGESCLCDGALPQPPTENWFDLINNEIDELEKEIDTLATEEYVAQKIAEAQLAEGEVDMSAYYTKSETEAAIEKAIDEAEVNVDLTNYYTKIETNEAIENAIDGIPQVDLSGYATKTYVSNQIALNETDLTNYATKDYVAKSITEAQLSGDGDADLSNYYTKTEANNTFAAKDEIPDTSGLASKAYVDNAIKNVSVEGYATETYVDNKIAAIEHPKTDLSNYYTKAETKTQIDNAVPDMSLYATKTYVSNQIVANEPDLTNYATQDYVNKKIDEAQLGDEGINLNGYYTKEETDTAISTAIGAIPEVDLSDYATKDEIPTIPTKVSVFTNDANYATKNYVDTAISNIEIPEGSEVDLDNYYTKAETNELIPDLTNYATKTYVSNQVAANATDLTNYYTKTQTDAAIQTAVDNIPSTGGGVEEVYVGTTEPTDTDALVWINPEGDTDDDIATIGYVDNAIANIEVDVDLSGYATTEYVDNQKVDLSGYATEEYVDGKTNGLATTDYVDNAVDNVSVDMTGYATEKYVDDAIAAIDIPTGGSGSGDSGRTEITPASVVGTYEDATGVTNYSSSNQAIRVPWTYGDLEHNWPYTVEVDIYNATDGSTNTYNFKIMYSYTDSNGFYYLPITEYPEVFNADPKVSIHADTNNGHIRFTSDPTTNYEVLYIRKLVINKDAEYSYSNMPIIGPGIELKGDVLTSKVNSLTTTSIGSIMSEGCKDWTNGKATYCSLLGYNNSISGSGTPKGAMLVGQSNQLSSSTGSNTMLLGSGNSCSSGNGGMAIGSNNTISANKAMAFGEGLTANTKSQVVLGQYNEANTYPITMAVGVSGSPRNGLTIDSNANVVIGGTVSSSGSDYAEYFEWADGNKDNEDRVGRIVALEGNKIRMATGSDDILGIVSGTATVLGDDAEWNWKGKYLKDEFGRIIYVDKEIFEEDEDGNLVSTGYHSVPVINPEYNPEEKYIPRKDRAEWDIVGLMGKLYVRDDGTANVGDYVAPTDGGIATVAAIKTNMRVLERITPNIIRVLLKG